MADRDDLYDPYKYSDDFNYALWTEGSVATLTNVSWDGSYRDVVRFPTRADLDSYIDNGASTVEVTELSYARPNMPVVLPISINRAARYNYIRVTNELIPGMSDTKRSYYYFISGVEFASPGATVFMLELDVWQTYVYDMVFNNCYIERGHIGIANSKNFDSFGRDYLTIPEGLDLGSEYQIVAHRDKNVMTNDEDPWGDWDNATEGMAVVIVITVKPNVPLGDENNPLLQSAGGSNVQGMPSGAEMYFFDSPGAFRNFMLGYSKYPWITQNVISVTVVPKPKRYGYDMDKVTMATGDDWIDSQVNMYTMRANLKSGNGTDYELFSGWRDNANMKAKIPARYRHLRKFFTSPYMMIELTAFTGTPIIMKPELWNNEDARIVERASFVAPNQRIVFRPYRYNAADDATTETYEGYNGRTEIMDDGGEYMDMVTQISNFPSFALVNNGAIAFMASNAHGLSYQHDQANWSQQKALQGAETSFRQASKGIDATMQQGQIGRNADMAGTSIANQMSTMGAGIGVANSMIGGVSGGANISNMGAAGVVAGVGNNILGAMQQQIGNNLNLGTRLSASQQSQDVSTGLSAYNRNTNNDLAQYVAKGDYSQAIAGINARVQDARLTQPSVSGQTGGEAFNLIHHMSKISVRWKLISQANMRAIGEYWLRYGYAVQQFGTLPASLMCMSNFTYWKLSETYVSGNVPEQFKQAFRGILEKGVTVWRSPDIIGQIDIADNVPLEGFTL